MGCCFSSDEDKDQGYPEPNERTRLLDPNVGNQNALSIGNRTGPQYAQESEKGDEQSAMARILHEHARDVIDVASHETPIEQQEYHDRARQYSNRLKMVLTSAGKSGAYKVSLPPGVTAPQMVLAASPVSIAEIQLITNVSEKASRAMREVRINHREDLVVSFGVPVP